MIQNQDPEELLASTNLNFSTEHFQILGVDGTAHLQC